MSLSVTIIFSVKWKARLSARSEERKDLGWRVWGRRQQEGAFRGGWRELMEEAAPRAQLGGGTSVRRHLLQQDSGAWAKG